MLIVDQRFNLPAEFLFVSFFVLIRFYSTSENDELAPLISFQPGDTSFFWRTVKLDGAYSQGKVANVLQDHLNSAADFFEIQALPFLPDETSQRFEHAKVDNRESWLNLLMTFPSFFSDLRIDLNENDFEELDFIYLTFVEWVSDIRFLEASESERFTYIREFPFLLRNEV